MIIDTLTAGGIKVSVVNLKKPSMDDVFVHYTGRELRDEGAEKTSTAATRAWRR
jgi:ABC-2 type transport system ATP-binding protein